LPPEHVQASATVLTADINTAQEVPLPAVTIMATDIATVTFDPSDNSN